MHALESHSHTPPSQVHVLESFRSTHWFVVSSHTSLHVDVDHTHDRFGTVHRPPGFNVLFWRAAAHNACRRRRRRRRAAALLVPRFRTSSNVVSFGSASDADAASEIKLSAGVCAAAAVVVTESAAAKAKRKIILQLAHIMVQSLTVFSLGWGLLLCSRFAIVTVRKSRPSDRGVSFGRRLSCVAVCSDESHIARRRDWAYVECRNPSGAYFELSDGSLLRNAPQQRRCGRVPLLANDEADASRRFTTGTNANSM